MAWKDTGRTIQREDGSIVSGLVPSRMTAADRLLVVAGPELLDALKALLDFHDGVATRFGGRMPLDLNAGPKRARLAIAKATGKAVQP